MILVIEDEPPIRLFLRISLGGQAYRVLEADTAAEGLRLFGQDIVFTHRRIRNGRVFFTKGRPRNNLSNLTWSFDLWPRCPLVTYPCGYAPRGRLARRQNPGVIFVNVISWRPLSAKSLSFASYFC